MNENRTMKMSDLFGIDDDEFNRINQLVMLDINAYKNDFSKVIPVYLTGSDPEQKRNMLRFYLLGIIIADNNGEVEKSMQPNFLQQLQTAIKMLNDIVIMQQTCKELK